jgi:hypothetical protein
MKELYSLFISITFCEHLDTKGSHDTIALVSQTPSLAHTHNLIPQLPHVESTGEGFNG